MSTPVPASGEVLHIEDRQGIRLLVMNRPDKRNALNSALTQALLRALREADQDASVGAVVLAGNGPAFCAGADIAEFEHLTPAQADRVDERATLTMQLHKAFPALSKPVVAAVHGPARGGGAGLALACDLVVMADTATLGYPEIRQGIVPAIVMTNLVRQLGRKAAFELACTGQPLAAERASMLGLANRVVPAAETREAAVSLAASMQGYGRQAMQATKSLFYRVAELPFDEGMDAGRQVNIMMRGFVHAGAGN